MNTTWTHRDMLRLSHPKHLDSAIAEFALHGNVIEQAPAIMKGYAQMTQATSVDQVVMTLNEFKSLPWETIPTQFLNNAEIWKALFYNGQLTGQNAIRNVSRLNKINAFDDMVFASDFAASITNVDNIKKSRLHPINYLNALAAVNNRYNANAWWGHEDRNTISINPIVDDALDDGFHAAFKFVEPANKRTVLGLDVSGSMGYVGAAGLNMSCAAAGAAMAMTIARCEQHYAVMGFADRFVDLGITPKMKLSSVMSATEKNNFGSTDCSLPIEWALSNGIDVDTFIIITDNETWAGRRHPHQALTDYRNKTGIPARLAVVGMSGDKFTIADPDDYGMMDFVGFDSNAPRAIADFSAGRV